LGGALFLAVPVGRRRRSVAALGTVVLLTAGTWAAARTWSGGTPEPRAPERGSSTALDPAASARALAAGLQMARDALAVLEDVADYTCTFTKRERARNLLGEERLTDFTMRLKVRHDPFSVYARFEAPASKRGVETIWVEGRNDGKMIAHTTGLGARLLGTMRLDPTGWKAMIDHRYPITRIGMRNLLVQFLAEAQAQAQDLARCETRLVEEQVAGRRCRCLEVRNPHADGGYPLALARLCIDETSSLPVRSERWAYVEGDGGPEARLMERYDYTDIVLDVGLTDLDFDPENPAYGY
jgi:hypothetical protein